MPYSSVPAPEPTETPESGARGGVLPRGGWLLAVALILALLGALAVTLVAHRAERAADAETRSISTARDAVLIATALAYPFDEDLVARASDRGLRVRFAEAVEIGRPLEATRAILVQRRTRARDDMERERIDVAVAAIDEAGAAIRATLDAPGGVDVLEQILPATTRAQGPIGDWIAYSGAALQAEQRSLTARRRALAAAAVATLTIGLLLSIILIGHLRRSQRLVFAALHRAAMTDPLTGVRNQGAFYGRVAVEVARSRRNGASLSLVLIDLDHFRRVNDAYGEKAGDAVLAAVGDALRTAGRKEDLIARIGGEEFAWLAVDTNGDGAMVVARRAREAIASVELEGICAITASAGVAEHRPDETAEDLVRRADEALYQAKAGGRDRAFRAGVGAPGTSHERRLPVVGVIRAP